MTPYTQIQIWRTRHEWLEWWLTPLFIFIFPTFLNYHIHLTWRADMYINLSDLGRKEINITYILDTWSGVGISILLDNVFRSTLLNFSDNHSFQKSTIVNLSVNIVLFWIYHTTTLFKGLVFSIYHKTIHFKRVLF